MVSYTENLKKQLAELNGLNPCCSGQWSRTIGLLVVTAKSSCSLNPCCSGQWSRTIIAFAITLDVYLVLILVVVDNGLVLDLIRLF